jgi:hypothetical protein
MLVGSQVAGVASMGKRAVVGGGVVTLGLFGSAVLAGCNLGAAPVEYAVPARQTVVGDVNGDGHLDIATFAQVDSTTSRTAILQGNGAGTFSPEVTTEPVKLGSTTLVDVDGDGDGDRIDRVYTDVDGAGVVQLRRSNGGVLDSPVVVANTVAWEEGDLTLGDVNEDGVVDLLTGGADGFGTGGLVVRLGDGAGRFGDAQTYGNFEHGPSQVKDIKLADLNRDGHPDVVATVGGRFGSFLSGDLWVGYGDGTGALTFTTRFLRNTPLRGDYGDAFLLDDFDEDGAPDLVFIGNADTSPYDTPGLFLLRGDGLGAFEQVEKLADGVVEDLASADIDSDGHLDLVTSSPATVRYGDGAGRFPDTHRLGNGGAVIAQDVDQDGKVDIITGQVIDGPTGKVAVYLNRTEGRPSH